MVRNSEQTRRRLLSAAKTEFARYGIAGARIDRIADGAQTNKQMIYAYFGNKDDLFDRVFSDYVAHSLDDVDFDARDLPAYAGRLFDRFDADPDSLRLSTWYRLERPQGKSLQAVIAVNEIRLGRLRDAQADGSIPDRFDPQQLLALVQSIATAWATMNPEFSAEATPDRSYRRATVVSAVAQLLQPSTIP